MGDDDGYTLEEWGTGFVVMFFVIFIVFEHSFPNSEVYIISFSLVSLLAVFLIIKGVWDIVMKKDGTTFLFGVAVSMVLILFFDGMGSIVAAFNLVFLVVEELLGIVAGL